MVEKARRRRGERAVERQLSYQEVKSAAMAETMPITALSIKLRAAAIRKLLEEHRHPTEKDRVLEVGSGAHGLIFGFEDVFAIGLDPLAVEYKKLFPVWQADSKTIAAVGEELPFDDGAFEVVLSDNVVDHAADPEGIIGELVRVLKPGGIMYFTVNTHHPVYQCISTLHGLWNSFGIRFEITPFADHTVHFTENRVRMVFERLPVNIVSESAPFSKPAKYDSPAKGIEAKIKRLFPKNILFEIIATKPNA